MGFIKIDIDKDISIKHDNETDLMQALIKIYELVLNRVDATFNRILQVVSIVFTALGLVVGYITNYSQPPVVSWILPAIFLPFFAYIIYCIYVAIVSLWNARIIARRINFILKESIVIRHEKDFPEAQYFSTRKGNLKFNALYAVIFFLSVCLFLVMLLTSFISIYNKANHLQGLLFLLFYGSILVVLIVSCSGFLLDLPEAFQKNVLDKYPNGEAISLKVNGNTNSSRSIYKAVMAVLLPREWDFVAKCFFFIFGLDTALILIGIPNDTIMGLPYSHLQLINALFGTNYWNNISVVPNWAIIALCLTYFFVEEVLLQQSKYIWDDIRGKDDDKKLGHNQDRAITSGLLPISGAIRQMFANSFWRSYSDTF